MYQQCVKDKIPSWFSNSKYEDLQGLDVIKIWWLLIIRQEVYNVISLNFRNLESKLSSFFSEPLALDNTFLHKKFCEDYNFPKRPSILPTSTVDSLCLFNINEYINGDVTHCIKALGTDTGRFDSIYVDLSASLEKIESDFKNWLKAKKKEVGKKVDIPSQGFISEKKRLIDNRVFQYLDLQAWFKVKNQKITDNEMAEILFPEDYSKGAENIRKTVRPNALRSIEKSYISWLEYEIGNKK